MDDIIEAMLKLLFCIVVIYLLFYGAACLGAQKICLESGFTDYGVTYDFNGFCGKLVDGTAYNVNIEELR